MLVILALLAASPFFKIWGFTYQHQEQLVLKDKLIEMIGEDRDYWRNQAIKGAETAVKQADHQDQITSILEAVTTKVAR